MNRTKKRDLCLFKTLNRFENPRCMVHVVLTQHRPMHSRCVVKSTTPRTDGMPVDPFFFIFVDHVDFKTYFNLNTRVRT